MTQNTIVILDFGSQYTQLITRGVENNLYIPSSCPGPLMLISSPNSILLALSSLGVRHRFMPKTPPNFPLIYFP